MPATRRPSPLPALLLMLALAGCGRGTGPAEDLGLLRLEANNAEIEGRFDWARINYGKIREHRPADAEILRLEGKAWLAGYQQSWGEGIRLLALSLELEEDLEARRILVERATALGELELARRHAASLGEDAYDDCLRAEAFLGEPATARGFAEKALAGVAEGTPPGLVARIRLLLAGLAEQRGELALAREHAEAATRAAPLDAAGFYVLGRLHRRDRDTAAAKAALERSEGLRHLSHDGTMKELPPAEALALLRRLEPEAAPAFSWSRRKLELLFANQLREEAELLIEKLRRDQAFGPRERSEAATWAEAAGSVQLARSLFESVLAEKPGDRGALSSLALLEIEKGDFKAARQRLAAAMAADNDIARYHFLLARLALAEDRAPEAEQHFRRALELAPWNWDWRQAYAELLLAQGRRPELQKLLEDLPETPPAAAAFLARYAKG